MTADPLAERLVRLGLTQYESRAYVVLIRRSNSTPADVARQADIPRPRVYDVLRSLVDKGVALDRPGNVTRVAPVDPELAVERLLQAHRARMEQVQQDATEIVAALGEDYRAGAAEVDPLDYVEVLRDRGALARRFEQLQSEVDREVLMFNKAPVVVTMEENEAGRQLAGRGTLRSLYEFDRLDDPTFLPAVRDFIEAGEEVRLVESLPTKLAIFDSPCVWEQGVTLEEALAARGDDGAAR